MKKIKIGFFNSFFPVNRGGSEYQTFLLSQIAHSAGFDIFFISLDSTRKGLHEIDGIKVYFFRAESNATRFIDRGYLSNWKYLKKILQQERPEIVYQRMGNSATGILQYWSGKLGYKFIWACANSTDIVPRQLSIIRTPWKIPDYILKNRGIRHADIVLAQTEEQRSIIKQLFLREAVVLRNGHPLPKSLPDKPENRINVVWIANLKFSKQPDLFLDLAAQLQDLSYVHFTIIGRPGSPGWQETFESQIRKMRNVDYLGAMSQEEVNRYLEKTHILVNTSLYEGFSNTFIQAWMRKVPVVSLNVDPDKLLSEGGLGFCSGSMEKLCQDVRCLAENHSLRKRMGKKACHYACEYHSMDKTGNQFLDIVNSLFFNR